MGWGGVRAEVKSLRQALIEGRVGFSPYSLSYWNLSVKKAWKAPDTGPVLEGPGKILQLDS